MGGPLFETNGPRKLIICLAGHNIFEDDVVPELYVVGAFFLSTTCLSFRMDPHEFFETPLILVRRPSAIRPTTPYTYSRTRKSSSLRGSIAVITPREFLAMCNKIASQT